MRWYVSRNGETTGPIDESVIAQDARSGELRGASIRDEHGGAWMSVPQSPFAALLPPDPEAAKRRSSAAAMLCVLFGISALFVWQGCSSLKDSMKESDAKFCRENLSYYENFCTVYPASCTEGARALAKCPP